MGIQALYFQHHHNAICLYKQEVCYCNFTLLITKKEHWKASRIYIIACTLISVVASLLNSSPFFYTHFFSSTCSYQVYQINSMFSTTCMQ